MQNDNNVTETKTKQDSEIKIQTTNAEIDALPEPTFSLTLLAKLIERKNSNIC